MLGLFTTPIHQMSLAVLSRAACASMSTTPTTTTTSTTTTTTTTRDRGDRYGPMEWAQSAVNLLNYNLVDDTITTFSDELRERSESVMGALAHVNLQR